MVQRNKLVDLIIESVSGCARHWAEVIADHLIENGVAIMPLKIGDIVYFPIYDYHDCGEITEIHCISDGKGGVEILFEWASYDVGVDVTELWDEGDFSIDEIGKTVFLTREEAQKALQKMQEKKGAEPWEP